MRYALHPFWLRQETQLLVAQVDEVAEGVSDLWLPVTGVLPRALCPAQERLRQRLLATVVGIFNILFSSFSTSS
jgi:hypothetical protein